VTTLLEREYRFCGLNDLSVVDDNSIAMTFDDAAGGAVDWIVERARIFDLQGTLFPVVDWLEHPPRQSREHAYRSLATWRDVERAHRMGQIIGSHGMSHVPMHVLASDQLVYELEDSKRHLERRCGTAVNHFAAPFGKLSPIVVTQARAVGYTTISSTAEGVNTEEDVFAGVLKRFVVRSDLPRLGLGDEWKWNAQ
jgi:peptidoglycan/xylan/chitin deacetylase (PgdA/CDA1 family)